MWSALNKKVQSDRGTRWGLAGRPGTALLGKGSACQLTARPAGLQQPAWGHLWGGARVTLVTARFPRHQESLRLLSEPVSFREHTENDVSVTALTNH